MGRLFNPFPPRGYPLMSKFVWHRQRRSRSERAYIILFCLHQTSVLTHCLWCKIMLSWCWGAPFWGSHLPYNRVWSLFLQHMSVDLTQTWELKWEHEKCMRNRSGITSSQGECFHVISSSPILPGVFLNNCMGTRKKCFLFLFYKTAYSLYS